MAWVRLTTLLQESYQYRLTRSPIQHTTRTATAKPAIFRAQQLERDCSYDGTYKSPEDIRREFDELSRGDKLIIDFLKLRAAPGQT